ncbi:MAG: 3-dehydroquinate synthase [Acidobacteria bacterium]|nr:3-dehydroquinate synthase [Acidobacteriota bacterium]
MEKVRVSLASPIQAYEIKIGSGLLRSLGQEVRRCLPRARRVAVISNRRVFDLYGGSAVESLQGNDFLVSHLLLGDGERFKSLNTLGKALTFLSETGLERNDAVLALGGGVIGDVAGFAAAAYLRGVPYFQVPTTLLAQIDSSVGGKTGVNLPSGKNLVGAFHQPGGVVIDTSTLETLPARELTAGHCEMVKNGAVGSRPLFQQTFEYLDLLSRRPAAGRGKKLESLIAAQCTFKAAVVKGDEREAFGRTDRRSRRILNFGHTVGHALEVTTGYRRFRHGEAVGYGMLVAGEMSKLLGLLKSSELELLRQAVRRCGPLPSAGDLNQERIIEAIGRDKKSVGGNIHWVLLERIGRARIVSSQDIPPDFLLASLRAVLKNRD